MLEVIYPIDFERVRSWLHNDAWPFWAREGVDRVNGGFVEHLDLDGRDGQADGKRVRAHARQVYCFSQAALLGFDDGHAISDHGWAFLTEHGRRADGGWGRMMGRTGALLDPTSDAYDLAFILFAHAWRYRLTQDSAIVESALEAAEWLERDLRHPNGLGWLADQGDAGPRQQNPHMHIIEATLELADATGHPQFAALGQEVAGLMCDHFLDRNSGVLREFFNAGWERLPGPQGAIVEPGHQFEWTWILLRAERILGLSLRREAEALYEFADRHGVDHATGLVYDQVNPDGHPIIRDSRSWPQTEALKAHLAMLETQGIDTRGKISKTLDNIFRYYLSPCPVGAWMDHRRHDGLPKANKIPSTTLYHLQLSFTELLRLQPLIEAFDIRSGYPQSRPANEAV